MALRSILTACVVLLVSSCGVSGSNASTSISGPDPRLGYYCVQRDRIYTYDGKPFAVVGEHRSCG